MSVLRTWPVAIASLAACGPDVADLSDVYPRNCGVEGPVDLLEVGPMLYGDVQRAGDHYLVELWRAPDEVERWAVDRCGEARVQLYAGPYDAAPGLGAAGDHLLSCDEATGAMAWLDPTGAEPPRPLFSAVEGCRVVPLGKGLAAQEKGTGTVWFHPDPSDPGGRVRVVTEAARVADPDWIFCPSGLRFDCESWHPFGIDIRAAGDELLVALASEELLAFSSSTLTSRILDPGPLFAMDVLPGGDRLVVSRDLGPTLIVERRTGASFEFCCWSDWEPIRLHGDWLVQGSFGTPLLPEPPQWTNFEALHLPSGAYTKVEGREDWSPRAPLTHDTIIADIGPYWSSEESRYVVSLATGERQPVELPGDVVWATPGRDGVFALGHTDEEPPNLHHLAGPGQSPRLLLEDVRVALATRHGRVVFERPREPGETSPLSVMLPDERVIDIDEGVLGTFAPSYYSWEWPHDTDEVVYAVADGDGWVLRRTVLP